MGVIPNHLHEPDWLRRHAGMVTDCAAREVCTASEPSADSLAPGLQVESE